ncbi:MAG: hypothetical protein CMJ30_02590 [Phycisphaerae bacterium]|nr:hypothetical protein [Phycisphaerae bacterium]
MPPILQLLRPADWVKNVFVLPALIFSLPRMVEDGVEITAALWATLAAVAGFCATASGFYAINDTLDAASDRQHPVKCQRPIASGAVSARTGLVLGVLLPPVSILAAFSFDPGLGWILLAYGILQVLYNLGLKRCHGLDVMALAGGFTLRAAGGAAAIDRPISVWLLLEVFFLTLFLAFIKRQCDLQIAKNSNAEGWKSPAGYHDEHELDWGTCLSGGLAVVVFVMYATSGHARQVLGPGAEGLVFLTPFVISALLRFHRRAREGASDSPLAAVLDDRIMFLSAGAFGLGLAVLLAFPELREALDGILMTSSE